MSRLLLTLTLLLLSFTTSADSPCEAYRPLHSFQLMGFHNTTACSCAGCHKGGVFKGTPTTCYGCHNGSRSPAMGPTANHIPTGTTECKECHGYTSFTNAHMTHSSVITPAGSCLNCHNGSYSAKAKPKDHIPTVLSCDVCHTTSSWSANFDHTKAGVVMGGGQCATCHNGQYARGLSNGHIPTGGASCDTCHKTFSTFRGGIYTHTGSEVCENCHNGQYAASGAIGKPVDHPATPNDCASCHNPSGWPCHTGSLTPWIDRMLAKLIRWYVYG